MHIIAIAECCLCFPLALPNTVCLSVCLPVCLSVFVCLSVCLPACLPVCLSVFVCLGLLTSWFSYDEFPFYIWMFPGV